MTEAARIDHIDLRFFIARNKFGMYEYSSFVPILGERFVDDVCRIVVDQERLEEISSRTWMDNYVARAEHLFQAVRDYKQQLMPSKAIEDFTKSDWQSFGPWLKNRIRNEPTAKRTQDKHILTSGKLLAILAQNGAIPTRIELSALENRKIAKPGESRFTTPRHSHKRKVNAPLSPFSFYIEAHGRAYQYDAFQPLARHFLLVVVPHLEQYYKQFAAGTAKKCHVTLLNFLHFLLETKENGSERPFFVQLSSGTNEGISSGDWERIFYRWRDALVTNGVERGDLSNHEHVTRMRRLWAHLEGLALVPPVVLKGFKNAKSKKNKTSRASLAQLTPEDASKSETEHEVWDRLSRFFDTSEQTEAHEFMRALCAEFSDVRALSIEELIERIHQLNDKRLQLLRDCAESDFLYWYRHWQHGQRSLSAVRYTADELIYLLDSPQLAESQRRKNSTALLTNRNNCERLGNGLLYVAATQNGIATGIYGRYHHLMRSHGDRFSFHAYLHPHPHATLALWVLILVDTGANVEVAREISRDCLRQDRTGHWQIILGNKERAGGKPIVDILPEAPMEGQQLSLPTAIRYYQEMSARYHALAAFDAKSYLLLHEYKRVVHGLEEWTARGWFGEFLSRHSELEKLDALPSMVRPSVLLSVQHEHADNIIAAQILGDHTRTATTFQSYTGRTATTLTYNLKIREFTERFQAVIIVSIQGAAAKLGLSEEEFARVLSDAHRTGLGVACLEPMAGIQPGSKKGEQCTRFDKCCGCKMRYVVATQENVADLVLFNQHLHASKDVQMAKNPDRWETRWLPWLVFSDIALAKLSQGETAAVFAEGTKLALSRKDLYAPIPLD